MSMTTTSVRELAWLSLQGPDGLGTDDSSAEAESQTAPAPGCIAAEAFPPRETRDPTTLARSIRSLGVLTPILVRRLGDGYQVVCGQHRLAAARAAGLREIPALIADLDDAEALRCYHAERQRAAEGDEASGTTAGSTAAAGAGAKPLGGPPEIMGQGLAAREAAFERNGISESVIDWVHRRDLAPWIDAAIEVGSRIEGLDAVREDGAGENGAGNGGAERPWEASTGQSVGLSAPAFDATAAIERFDRILARAVAYFQELRATRSINVPRTEILVDSILDLADPAAGAETSPASAAPQRAAPILLRGFQSSLDGDFTAPHALLVTQLCARLAKYLRWDDDAARTLIVGGFLHDVGMGFVLDALARATRSRDDEVRTIQSHTRIGCALIAGAGEWEPAVSQCALEHHERWNGTGYPSGKREAETPLPARLVGLLDCYAALITARPHRAALDPQFARQRLERAVEIGFIDPSMGILVREFLGGVELFPAEPMSRDSAEPLTKNSVELRGDLVTMLAKAST